MQTSRDPYFDWLRATVEDREHSELLHMLHSVEFKAKNPEDANRGMDGMRLRVEFMDRHGAFGSATNRGPCTMLEFFVALAKQMSFLMYGNAMGHRTAYYFWIIMKNLRLSKLTDDKWHVVNGEFFTEDAIFRVVDRKYDPDGNGGMFPLKHPQEDQRCVEIWYQMHAWLGENSDIDLEI